MIMLCGMGNRAPAAIIGSRQITGPAPEVIAEPVAETGPLWHERHAVLTSRPRRRAVGAGAKGKPVFVDRLLAISSTCVTTITRASGEVRQPRGVRR
jgi:hypothetical protein